MSETIENTEKNYELRPLVASDMGVICKIITAIGVRQLKECFNVDQVLKKSDSVLYSILQESSFPTFRRLKKKFSHSLHH